jgi:hypothetical protein
LAPFCAHLASKFEKYDLKNFFLEKIKKASKNAEFHADFKPAEEVFRKCSKKNVISKTSLTKMSKSGKSAYFYVTFLLITFLVNFFKTFSTDLKSA